MPHTTTPKLAMPYDIDAWLEGFECVESESLSDDLRLTHMPCGEVVCMVEADDTMSVLVRQCLTHVCATS